MKFSALAVLAIMSARADESGAHLLNLSLEELGSVKVDTVFAASKFSEKVTDAPSSVSIVTRREIQQLGYRTLGEIIRGVRSFDVTYDRNYSYTGVRGFNRPGDFGTRTLLLIDGHRMNDPVYDSTAVGTDALLDVDLIERVEFIRGPGSAIYGSNAFFGVINVVTRRGGDVNGAEAAGSIGSFDAYTGRFTLGKKLRNGVEFLLSGTTQASDGPGRLYYREFDSPETNGGIAQDRDGDRAWSLFGSLRAGDFTLQGGCVSRDKDVPTASYAGLFNGLNTTVDTRAYAELRYAHETDTGWNFFGRASYDEYDYHELLDYGTAAEALINNDSARARWWTTEVGLGKSFFNRFRFTMGLEYRNSTDVRQHNYDQRPFASYLDTSDTQGIFGAYLDGALELWKPLSLVAGLRYDRYDSFGGTTNPRLGLIVHPAAKTTLKLLYGRAFRAPNIYESQYIGTGQTANPNLRPEKIETYEFIAEHYFDAHWRASLSLFQNNIAGLIDQDENADGLVFFANTGDDRVRGVEAEAEGKWDGGLLVRASYTHDETRSGRTGLRLENSPRDVVRVQTLVPLAGEKLSAGLEFFYASERLTLARQSTGNLWLCNATLFSRELRPGLELSASVQNVFDRRYGFPGGNEHAQDIIEQDGRTFRLKVSYRF